MPANCCRELLLGKVASEGRVLFCLCGERWIGRAGKWVSEGGAR